MRPAAGPMYARIESDLRKAISDGELPLGSRVPSEEALGERYGVSRMTARQALERLVAAGLLVRRQGVGTFVSDTRVARVASRLLGFREDARAQGLEPVTRVLRQRRERAGVEDAALLAIDPGDEVLRVRRLRFNAEQPIGINTVVVAPPFVGTLAGLDYVESFYEGVSRELGCDIEWARNTIEAIAANPEEAALLGLEPGAPLLRSVRITYLSDGRLLGLTRTLYRGDRYYYALTIRRGVAPMAP